MRSIFDYYEDEIPASHPIECTRLKREMADIALILPFLQSTINIKLKLLKIDKNIPFAPGAKEKLQNDIQKSIERKHDLLRQWFALYDDLPPDEKQGITYPKGILTIKSKSDCIKMPVPNHRLNDVKSELKKDQKIGYKIKKSTRNPNDPFFKFKRKKNKLRISRNSVKEKLAESYGLQISYLTQLNRCAIPELQEELITKYENESVHEIRLGTIYNHLTYDITMIGVEERGAILRNYFKQEMQEKLPELESVITNPQLFINKYMIPNPYRKKITTHRIHSKDIKER
ncbi:hypothetical protein LJC18_00025 [Lachnospiraceae bacterium OttesenSCG-928-E19]|nr:hypothetical protein [Lachnospiraceae bacterium OttesenSCG-928-E19]